MDKQHKFSREEKIQWFGEGEWVDEPDYAEFEHMGLDCIVLRVACQDGPSHMFGGYLNGYVRLPENHPWIGLGIIEVPAEVHGGVTFSQEQDGGWIIGFDCMHSFDYNPSMEKLRRDFSKELFSKDLENLKARFPNSPVFNQTYRTFDYVLNECKSLAEQVHSACIPLA